MLQNRYQFIAKYSEIKIYSLCLGNISKDFSVDNINKIGLNGLVYNFSVTFDIIDITSIHKYSMKKHIK